MVSRLLRTSVPPGFSMTEACKVLPILKELGLTDHEAVAAIQSSADIGNIHLVEKRVYELLSGDNPKATVRFNVNGRIYSIEVLSNIWKLIYPRIKVDLATKEYDIARSIVFSSRPITGFARVPAWLQLRPVAFELKDARFGTDFSSFNTKMAPFPIVMEVKYRRSGLYKLQSYRRYRSIQETQWLLSAFIDTPIFGFSGGESWAILDGSYQLVSFGMGTGLEDETEDDFSSPGNLQELQPIPTDAYYNQMGINEHNLRVPDLKNLFDRFNNLSKEKKVKFLRAAAALWSAFQPGVNQSQRLVSLVSALEPLLEKPEHCSSCGSTIGITKSFRHFLDEYVAPSAEVRHIYEAIYSARSKLVHGGWNYEVDEPFMTLSDQGYITTLAAWGATKIGVVNWLLAH